ncbi:MAG: Asp-tRNA(Asn)/Glu-tRNA(Gln) amidotransferase subunit GatC [Actinomycetota bacterium]
MSIQRSDVEHVAKLARLDLTEQELDLYRQQLSRILEHAGRVTSLDTTEVPPTSHPIELSNVFRPDDPDPSLDQSEALANAPLEESGHFRVPRIMEEEL